MIFSVSPSNTLDILTLDGEIATFGSFLSDTVTAGFSSPYNCAKSWEDMIPSSTAPMETCPDKETANQGQEDGKPFEKVPKIKHTLN